MRNYQDDQIENGMLVDENWHNDEREQDYEDYLLQEGDSRWKEEQEEDKEYGER